MMRPTRKLRSTLFLGSRLAVAVASAIFLVVPLVAQQPPCDTNYNNFNGPHRLYVNLHNCGTVCALQELPYLELFRDGITGVRIAPVPLDFSQAPNPEFFTVNPFDPYFNGVIEMFGPENVLVLIDDGVDSGPHAKPTPNNILSKLTSLLARHPEVRHVEFMNEPLNFSNIGPEEYVNRYLRPARVLVDEYNADRAANNQIILYSAAWIGTADGVRRARRMVRAGALAYADVMTAHIYEPRADAAAQRAREYKRLSRGKPIAITESNFNRSNSSDYNTQQWWICDSMTRMEQVMRQGLSAQEELLQQNVLYTLRADKLRRFNLIGFVDTKTLNWDVTGPGHFVVSQRSQVPTDPKGSAAEPSDSTADPADDDGGEESAPGGLRGPGGRGD